LISGRETDLLDEGPLVEPTADDEVEASGIHAFPKGTRAGTCLHEILEEIDFADLDGAPLIVQRRLRAYGIEGFDEVVTDNLHALCRLPLLAGKDRFSLADLPGESRMAELEFSFPVDSFTTKKMAALFEMEKLPLRIDRLQFQTVNGFMTGFIDLVFAKNGRFYFADWKSNWLGPTTGAYSAARIAGEMEHNFYTLQLCLYSVALDRYLRLRQPGYDFDKHFGGAFYIFLRGIDPERPTNGIYFQRLNRELIEKLNAIFQE
jgi:exodeoxyribonuclease V beta subunit